MNRIISFLLPIIFVAGCVDQPTVPHAAKDAHFAEAASARQVLVVPDDFPTIQGAVDAASEGTIVNVRGGTYRERVVITTSRIRVHASAGAVLDGSELGGIGVEVLGSPTQPVTGVEVSGLEVRNFERGIIVQWASGARVHRNEVHHNLDRAAPLQLGDAVGIELVSTRHSEVSQNFVHSNGDGGIQLRVGSTGNVVRGNRVHENGTQRTSPTDMQGRGILLTGAGTQENQVLENEVLRTYGRGIMLGRPAGTVPITGNRIAQNRAHDNQRSGIALMGAVTGNTVLQNDARGNNLSGLAPCYQCNLVDLSIGGNAWERNLGTFNLTDACAP